MSSDRAIFFIHPFLLLPIPSQLSSNSDKHTTATMVEADKEPETSSLPSLIDTDQSLEGASMYKYRDFSVVNDEELEQETRMSAPSPPPESPRGSVESSIRVQKFPVKLYAILGQKEFNEIITWMPHGRSWKVLKPNLFESFVMPLFFEYSNYHSFNRLVNAWSFRRISSGPDRGSYYHELFLRGKPQLQKFMRRLPKTHKKLPMKKDDEPDFYALDKANPLPSLEESSPCPGLPLNQSRTQQLGMGHHGMVANQIPINVASGIGMSAFDSRDPIMGMVVGQQRAQTSLPTNNLCMNGMSQMGGMGGLNIMNTMNAMGSVNAVGTMNGFANLNAMNQMNSLNGLNSFLDPSSFGNTGDATGDIQFQRLRQMQLFDLQMGGPSSSTGGLGNDTLSMNFMLNRQQC